MRKFNKLSLINQFMMESSNQEREIKLRHDKRLTLVNKRPEVRFRVVRSSYTKEVLNSINARQRAIDNMVRK